jgi:hypothetical protein
MMCYFDLYLLLYLLLSKNDLSEQVLLSELTIDLQYFCRDKGKPSVSSNVPIASVSILCLLLVNYRDVLDELFVSLVVHAALDL